MKPINKIYMISATLDQVNSFTFIKKEERKYENIR